MAGNPPKRRVKIGGAHLLIEATVVDNLKDPATQVREPDIEVINIPAQTVTITRPVRAKTAQELSDEKDAIANIIMTEPGLVAFIKCINDGSIVPGANASNAALKAAIRGKL